MCYSVIPGQTGLLAVCEVETPQKNKAKPIQIRTRRRPVNPVPKAAWILASATAPRIVSMSPEFIKDNRRERRSPYDKGKHRAKHFVKCRSKRLARRLNEPT